MSGGFAAAAGFASLLSIGRGQQQRRIGRGKGELLRDADAMQTVRLSFQNLEYHAGWVLDDLAALGHAARIATIKAPKVSASPAAS